MLPYAIIAITMALFFYTLGVCSEKKQGILKRWHLVVFWTGFLFDTAGTSLMSMVAKNGFQFNIHGITGLIAIVLMLFHAIWATVAFIRNNEKVKRNFHKFSMIVWLIWLIPYLSGVVLR